MGFVETTLFVFPTGSAVAKAAVATSLVTSAVSLTTSPYSFAVSLNENNQLFIKYNNTTIPIKNAARKNKLSIILSVIEPPFLIFIFFLSFLVDIYNIIYIEKNINIFIYMKQIELFKSLDFNININFKKHMININKEIHML